MPLTGWIFVSTGWSFQYSTSFNVPTVWFGLFTVPHLPGFAEAAPAAKKAVAGLAIGAHERLAYLTLALAALHIAAALKHHVFDRDETLVHMLPFLRRKAPPAPRQTESA
jgi:cytochrome b561